MYTILVGNPEGKIPIAFPYVLCFEDVQDWRTHLEQMQKHRSGIDEALTTTKGQLDKLHSDISSTLEKIGSREKYLGSQLEPLLVQYRALQVSNSQFHCVTCVSSHKFYSICWCALSSAF